jgi:hypothetical protein
MIAAAVVATPAAASTGDQDGVAGSGTITYSYADGQVLTEQVEFVAHPDGRYWAMTYDAATDSSHEIYFDGSTTQVGIRTVDGVASHFTTENAAHFLVEGPASLGDGVTIHEEVLGYATSWTYDAASQVSNST